MIPSPSAPMLIGPVAADVAEGSAARTSIDAIIREFHRVDVLVNNAGIVMRHAGQDLPSENWHRAMAVDLDGVYNWSQTVAKG